jgi:RNA polymerase sigma factor (sigma-70 family)
MNRTTALTADAGLVVLATGRPPFDEFYRCRYAPMVRLAAALVDRRELAEEVVQDAFAAMVDRYAGVQDPDAYLRSCVVNGSRRVLRRRIRDRQRPVPPEEIVDNGYDHLLDAVRRLPLRQRTVVVLRYQLGLTDVEIAAAAGMPVGSVKSSLARARDRLRKEIER